jgi:hypothetical protein
VVVRDVDSREHLYTYLFVVCPRYDSKKNEREDKLL